MTKKLKVIPINKQENDNQIINVNLNLDYRILNEGRSRGLTFAFGYFDKNNVLNSLYPQSTCKDYLNDIVYSETTGNPIEVYGLVYTKRDLFLKHKPHLILSVRKVTNYEEEYNSFLVFLIKNKTTIISTLNKLEELLGFYDRSTIHDTDSKDSLVIKLSRKWVTNAVCISLAATIIRYCSKLPQEFSALDLLINHQYDEGDTMTREVCKYISYLVATKSLPEAPSYKDFGNTQIHNYGFKAASSNFSLSRLSKGIKFKDPFKTWWI